MPMSRLFLPTLKPNGQLCNTWVGPCLWSPVFGPTDEHSVLISPTLWQLMVVYQCDVLWFMVFMVFMVCRWGARSPGEPATSPRPGAWGPWWVARELSCGHIPWEISNCGLKWSKNVQNLVEIPVLIHAIQHVVPCGTRGHVDSFYNKYLSKEILYTD